MFRKCILLCLMICCFVCGMAQNSIINPSTVPTPNQSSLGTYGIIPVSPYTGKADISVPIYSTEQRGVPLDIRLSYETSGLRINQLPGWTGHNWTLLAGGAITRKINGQPDEVTQVEHDIEYVMNVDNVNYLTGGEYSNETELNNHFKEIYYFNNESALRSCFSCKFSLYKECWNNYVKDVDYYEYEYICEDGKCILNQIPVFGYYFNWDNSVNDMYLCDSHRFSADEYAKYETEKYIDELKEKYETQMEHSFIGSYFLSGVNLWGAPVVDSSADIFYFNFLGFSGYFFYGKDGWKVQSEQNVDVWFDVDDQSNYITPLEDLFWYKDYKEGRKLQLAVKQPKQIKGFTLVDENGNRYVFGGDKSAIEWTMSLTGKCNLNTSDSWKAVSWMLKEVRDRYGNILYEFDYSRGENIVQVHNSYSTTIRERWEMVNSDKWKKKEEVAPNYYSASITSPVYLDKISVRDGTDLIFRHTKVFNTPNVVCDVDSAYYKNFKFNIEKEESFFYNNASDVLYPDDIDIKAMLNDTYWRLRCDKNGYDRYTGMTDNKNYWFKSIFQDSCEYYLKNINLEKLKMIIVQKKEANTDEQVWSLNYDFNNKMHLTSVCRKGDNPYVFEYKDYDKVPRSYMSKQFDFWGYYNGVDYDRDYEHDLDYYWSDDSIKYADYFLSRNMNNTLHKPSFQHSMCGMMTKITYPTGGYSTLEYELNSCSIYLNENKKIVYSNKDIPVGGLRIKSVSTYNFDDKLIGGQQYSYTKSGKSTGELNSLPVSYYEWYLKDKLPKYKKYYTKIHENIISSVCPMSNTFVPSVGYTNVFVTELDGSKTEYSYSNFSSELDDIYDKNYSETLSPYVEYSSRNYMRGKLLSELKYDKNDTLIHKNTYTYASDKVFNKTNYVRTLKKVYNAGSEYRLYYFHPHVTKIVEETKYENEWIVQTTNKVTACDDVTVTPDGMKPHTVNLWLPVRETKECGKDSVSQIMEYYYSEAKDNDIAKKLTNQFCIPVKSVQNQYNGVLIGGETTQYGVFYDNVAPESVYAFKSNPEVKQLKGQILSYYPDFSVKEMNDGNGINHKFYWNKDEQLLASVANAKSDLVNIDAGIDRIKMSNMDEIFTSKDIDANLYSYDKKGRLITTFGANGIKMDYAYSENDRLQSVKKNDKRLMDFRYHFRPSKYKANIENEFDYFTETRIPGKTPSGKLKYEIRFGAKNVEFKMRLITGGGRETVWTYKVRDYSKLKGEFRSPGLPSRGDYVLEIYEDGKYVGEAWTRFSK